MSSEEQMQLFEDQAIRTAWDEASEIWYFSIVDVVGVLTEQTTQRNASNYWAKLKLKASDGKHRLTDVATTEQLFRIIQSIPSPKAEPLKLWLAQVGRERIDVALAAQ